MSTLKHAELEFKAAGWLKEDGTYVDESQKWICEDVLKLLEIFSKQGHSGTSAPYAINLFEKLANQEPICPLTGEDWEWNDVSKYMDGKKVYQNKRCSHVFKENDQAYDCEGKIFREPDGCCYQSQDSKVDITFPYTPKREYVDVPKEDK